MHELIRNGDFKTLARALSLVENSLPGSDELLMQLQTNENTRVIGITGPPGAGKSSLINAMLMHWIPMKKKVAILSVDPSSPFTRGALLGDRVRMQDFYLDSNVFIRSAASRGSLGGLNPRIIEMCDVLCASDFDFVLIETVGVGQSEIEIASIADTTLVVLVPESGDGIQAMKSGLMEVADIFVVNKSDRANASEFARNLVTMIHEREDLWETPVIKTVATENSGIDELLFAIGKHTSHLEMHPAEKSMMLTNKAVQLILEKRMSDIDRRALQSNIVEACRQPGFNLYRFIMQFY